MSKMSRLYSMAIFSTRLKFPILMLQLFFVSAALGLSVARIFMPNRPRGRSGTMALGMAAKSLAIIMYELLTAHVPALHRWASLKANLILNAMEVAFWGAVVFMTIQSQTQQTCVGTTCTIGWVIVVLGILLSKLASYATIILWLDFRHLKKKGVPRGAVAVPLQSRCEDQSVDSVQIHEIGVQGRKSEGGYARQQQQQQRQQQQQQQEQQRKKQQRRHSHSHGHQQQYTHQPRYSQQQHHQHQQVYAQPTYPEQSYGQENTQHGYGRQ